MTNSTYTYAETVAAPDAPLFFTFHGTGGNEQQFHGLASSLLPSAHVISPRGDVSEHGALRFFKRTGEGVYDMADLAFRTGKMAEFVQSHKLRLTASRVVGLGYSNGANILASIMFQHADLFDEVVLLHPLIPFTPATNQALKSARVLVSAGRADPICPAATTEALIAYFKTQGSAVSAVWHNGGHELQQTEIEAAQRFLAS